MRQILCVFGLTLAGSVMADTPGLSEIYNLSVANDPAVRLQVATRDATASARDEVEATRGISVDSEISGSYTESYSGDDDYQTGSLAVTVSVPLLNTELDASIDAQSASARAADATLTGFRQSHIITVSERYFAVLSAEQDLLAAEAEVTAFERQLEQATERLNVGIGTRVDVDQARAQLDLSQVGLISAEVALRTAQSNLAQLVGVDINGVETLSRDFEATVHRQLQTSLDQHIEQHPDVLAKVAAFQSARADLRVARAETTPSLALSSRFAMSDSSGSNNPLTNATSRSNVVSLTLSAPIYTNGSADASIARAEAQLIQAEADLETVRRRVQTNIQVATGNLTASARTVEARELAIVSATSRVEATEAAYEVGSGDIIEVLNAQKDLIAAERDLQKARHTHVIRQLEFDEALGDLSEAAIARVDQYLQ
jgi:outer membrane protein